MDTIAARVVYDILVRAGAERSAEAFAAHVPRAASGPLPRAPRLPLGEDDVALEAMVRAAVAGKSAPKQEGHADADAAVTAAPPSHVGGTTRAAPSLPPASVARVSSVPSVPAGASTAAAEQTDTAAPSLAATAPGPSTVPVAPAPSAPPVAAARKPAQPQQSTGAGSPHPPPPAPPLPKAQSPTSAIKPLAPSVAASDALWEDATAISTQSTPAATSATNKSSLAPATTDDVEEVVLAPDNADRRSSSQSTGPAESAIPSGRSRAPLSGWGDDDGATTTAREASGGAPATSRSEDSWAGAAPRVSTSSWANDGGDSRGTTPSYPSTARTAGSRATSSTAEAGEGAEAEAEGEGGGGGGGMADGEQGHAPFPSSRGASTTSSAPLDMWEDATAGSPISPVTQSSQLSAAIGGVGAGKSAGGHKAGAGASTTDVIEEDFEDDALGSARPASRPSSATIPASASRSTASAPAPHSSSSDSSRRALSLFRGTTRAISAEEAARLRMVLLGQLRPRADSKAEPSLVNVQALRAPWLQQGLAFLNEAGLRYGMPQGQGGPCGPLACVNAQAIRHMYYSPQELFAHETACEAVDAFFAGRGGGGSEDEDAAWPVVDGEVEEGGMPLDPDARRRDRALVLGITELIWRCRAAPGAPAYFSVLDESIPRSPPLSLRIDGIPVSMATDGVTERLRVYTCASPGQLAAAVEAHLPLLTTPQGPGLVAVVYSAMLTRGPSSLLGDLDLQASQTGGALVGSYGYASQELVNLLLTGRAASNTFDGDRVFEDGSDKLVLAGIRSQSTVGFLSVLHVPGYMTVGAFLREPRAPVWVIFGESHYAVLFAAPKKCVWPAPSARPRPTYGRKRTDAVFPPDPARCLGTEAANGQTARPLDIVYFDGLARQDELFRLTVLPGPEGGEASPFSGGSGSGKSGSGKVGGSSSMLELSGMELWTLSRWPGSKLAWNDIDPWEPMRVA
jgi:hypothetical protein